MKSTPFPNMCIHPGCPNAARNKKAAGYCPTHKHRAYMGRPMDGYEPLTTTEQITKHTATQGECVVWTGALTHSGYGQVNHQGRTRFVHRVVWEEAHGPIPTGGHICHRCDNPPCVRLDHLFLGTNADNRRDSVLKDRHQRGERHYQAKVTDQDVREIRASTESNTELALRYGIHRRTVADIRLLRTWKHVT